MTAELIAILAVGVALTGVLLATRLDINTRLDRLEDRIDRMDDRLKAVELGQAKLEGLLEGLREAIAGRRPADTAA